MTTTSVQSPSRLPLICFGLLLLAWFPIAIIAARLGLLSADEIPIVGAVLVWAVLGLVVALRQPGNAVAWILFAVATGIELDAISEAILVAPSLSADLVDAFATTWGNSGYWFTFIVPLLLLMYIFPTGHFLTRRWRWAGWVAGFMSGLIFFLEFFRSEVSLETDTTTIPNPIGFHSIPLDEGLGALVFGVCLLALVIGGPVAVVARFRRSSSVVRAQIKLVLVSMTLIPLIFVFGTLLGDSFLSDVVFFGVLLGIPVAITIAIVRYNLFDIDVVSCWVAMMGRALVYPWRRRPWLRLHSSRYVCWWSASRTGSSMGNEPRRMRSLPGFRTVPRRIRTRMCWIEYLA